MKIHHLNLGTLRPPGAPFAPPTMTCHCLLIETSDRLILVDTGLGTMDVENPHLLGLMFRLATRPVLDPNETAIAQLRALGFKAGDVREIILTHLDLDHAGGLPDFPQARVHVLDVEHQVAFNPQTLMEKGRYVKAHWKHQPKWLRHTMENETWFDIPCSLPLPDTDMEMRLVFLPGHTRGHAGVAMKTPAGWLLHAGDAYFHHIQMDPQAHSTPIALKIFQQFIQMNGKQTAASLSALRRVLHNPANNVRAFCTHDAEEFEKFRAQAEGVKNAGHLKAAAAHP